MFLSSESFPRRRRRGADALPAEVKTAIRVAYAEAGRPYDLALTLSPREANRIVKPATYGAPPVPWWED